MDLMELIHSALTVRNLVSQSWRYRHAYATPVDAYKGFLMRTAIGRKGRKLLPKREVKLRIPDSSEPVYLRRGMSDFQVFMDLFEQKHYDVVKKLPVRANPIIFDLGGNIGLATRRMSILLPNAKFLAVEPDPNNREMFKKNNLAMIDSGRVTLIGGFVAAEDGVATIDRGDGFAAGFRMRAAGAEDQEIIPCVSMGTLMQKAGADKVDIAKIDIEGAEQKLFATCAPWIQRIQSIIVECHLPYTYQMFFDDLNRAGWNHEIVLQSDIMACVRRI
jgi:FkbM family methyltransferase